MRIVHLTTYLQGGAGRAMTNLAVAQQAAGHHVHLFTSATNECGYLNYPDYLHELAAARVDVHCVDSLFDRRPASHAPVLRALTDIVVDTGWPDLIHTHAATPSAIALTFAAMQRRAMPIVQTMHGWGVNKTAEQAARDVATLNRVGVVAVPSRHSADLLMRLGVESSRIVVIPYGVTAQRPRFDPPDEQLILSMVRARHAGALVVACVGTFGVRKNQALLIEAIRRVGAEQPESRAVRVFAVLVGDGDSADLRERVQAAGLHDRVVLYGYSRAARAIAAAADVLVLPSRSEGQPVAVLEAFCDGVLVCASDVPELRELVEEGITGVTFTAESADALAQALVTASRLPAPVRRAIRSRAQHRYGERHTPAAMFESYLTAYAAARRIHSGNPRRLPAAAATA
jgi:glycosyltransferase involved in cell wall biosynthesis